MVMNKTNESNRPYGLGTLAGKCGNVLANQGMDRKLNTRLHFIECVCDERMQLNEIVPDVRVVRTPEQWEELKPRILVCISRFL